MFDVLVDNWQRNGRRRRFSDGEVLRKALDRDALNPQRFPLDDAVGNIEGGAVIYGFY